MSSGGSKGSGTGPSPPSGLSLGGSTDTIRSSRAPRKRRRVKADTRHLDEATAETPVPLGRYLIKRRLGAGGMGVVYEGHDPERDVRVAVKTLHTIDADALYRLKEEFRHVAHIQHRNLAVLHELVSDRDTWFFAMEFIEGVGFLEHVFGENYISSDALSTGPPPMGHADTARRSSPDAKTVLNRGRLEKRKTPGARTLLRRADPEADTPLHDDVRVQATRRISIDEMPSGEYVADAPTDVAEARFDEARLRVALLQLAEGLQALHDNGVLHLDIKPANIMVDRDGRVVLLDFGLARHVAPKIEAGSSLPPGMIVGTPAYMSPEQAIGKPMGCPADWYAFGGVMYRALTALLPFRGPPHAVLLNKQDVVPTPPSELLTGIPPDLDALCNDLLAIEPSARPTGPEVLRRLGGRHESDGRLVAARERNVFVGREPQLTALRQAYEDSRRGVGVVACVHGLSGMGKSSLVTRYLKALEGEGALVISGRCYERESMPYKAFDNLVDNLASHLRTRPVTDYAAIGPASLAAIGRVFPVLGGLVEGLAPDVSTSAFVTSADAQQARRQAFRALRRLISLMAAQRPLVLHIDDAQWSDRDSAQLMNSLLAPPEAPQVLFVLSYRTDEVSQSPLLLDLLQRDANAPPIDTREVAVGPLSEDQARRLALELMRDPDNPAAASDDDARARAIAAESGGSPLFVEELVHFTQSTGAAEDRDAEPVSLTELVRRRLESIPPHLRSLVALLSVAARPIAQDLVFRAAGLSGDLVPALTRLQNLHLVRIRGIHGDDAIESYHDRIRGLVYDLLSPEHLKRHHARLASTLAAASDVDPEVLARHFHGAGELPRAAKHVSEAAKNAAGILAFDRAAELYGLAIEWSRDAAIESGSQVNMGRVRKFRRARAEALVNAGRGSDAAPLFLECAQSAMQRSEEVELRMLASKNYLVSGLLDEGVGILRPLLRDVGLRYPESMARAVLSLLGSMASLGVRGTTFKPKPREQIAENDLLRMEVGLAAGQGFTSFSPVLGGTFSLLGLRAALRCGDTRGVVRGLAYYALMTGYPATPKAVRKADTLYAEAEALARPLDEPYLDGMILLGRGVSAVAQSRWSHGLELLGRASDAFDQCVGVAWDRNVINSSRTMAMIWQGDLKAATGHIRDWEQESAESGDLYAKLSAKTVSSLTILMAGDPATASNYTRETMSRWSTSDYTFQHLFTLRFTNYCDLYQGDPERALARVEEGWGALKRSRLLDLQLMRVDALSVRTSAMLAVAQRAKNQRKRLLKRVRADANTLRKIERPYGVAAAQLCEAAVAHLNGDEESAVVSLRRAADTYAVADMKIHRACARAREGQLVGGSQGQQLVREAYATMTAEGIVDPARWCDIYAPGYG